MTWRDNVTHMIDRWHAQPSYRKVTITVAWLAILAAVIYGIYSAIE